MPVNHGARQPVISHVAPPLPGIPGNVLLPSLFLLQISGSIKGKSRFPLQLHVTFPAFARKLAVSDRLPYRTARLGLMPAIAEPAKSQKVLHIIERFTEAFAGIPHAKLTHSRGVYDHCAASEHDKLAVGSSMSAF